jgi:hypothetical protein
MKKLFLALGTENNVSSSATSFPITISGGGSFTATMIWSLAKTMGKFLLVALFFFLAPLAKAQCTGGSSPNWTWTLTANFSSGTNNLQGCVNQTKDGDTITISAGSITLTTTTGVHWSNKGITITGTGTPNSTPSTTGASSSCSQTSITFNVSSTIVIFQARPTYGNSTTRLSCIAFPYGTGPSQPLNILGTCSPSGCPNLHMDNLTFTGWTNHADTKISYGIMPIGDMFGVIDHNTVTGTGSTYLQLAEISHASYLGVGHYGDNAWAQSESYGSANFLFLENNAFSDAGCCENEGNAGGLSTQGGTRVVARYNTFFTSSQYNFTIGWHGTESSGRPRGGRAFEYYRNTITYPSTCVPSGNCAGAVAVRSGTGIAWGNTIDSGTVNISGGFVGFNTLRSFGDPGGWGACDGTFGADNNDSHGAYFSGTIGSVSGQTITVSGTSPGWATNYWTAGNGPSPQPGGAYSIHDVTQTASVGVSVGSEIASNGANTLTYSIGGPSNYVAAAGDSIQITRAFSCLDQGGGRGAGVLYNTTSHPTSGSFQTAATSQEVPSPGYVWMNAWTNQVVPGGQSGVGADVGRVIRNRNYYTENTNQAAQTSSTSPFDGTTSTTGIGHGTLENRPTTCTPSVGYWATDQGSWNTSGSGGQGELFVCTATNTWSLNYTPYTYPHPLVSGVPLPPPPAAPTNLVVTVQ